VVTILSLDPKDLYDVLAINAASRPPRSPACRSPAGRRRARRADRSTWVAFPTVEQLEKAVFDMVVAAARPARGIGDVAIMMVEAEATDNVIDLIAVAPPPTESVVAEARGRKAVHRRAVQRSAGNWRQAPSRSPTTRLPGLPGRRVSSVASVTTEELTKALQIAGKTERNDRTRRDQSRGARASRRDLRRT